MKKLSYKIDMHPKLANFINQSKWHLKTIPGLLASLILYIGMAFVAICPFLVLGYIIDKAFHYSLKAGIWTVAIPVVMILYFYIVSMIMAHKDNI